MSTVIDLLALTQEEVVMRVIAKRLAVDYDSIHPKYFTFEYNPVDDNLVAVVITARQQAATGELGIWSSTRTVQFYRANLRGTASARVMQVSWVPGMAMEHVMRALRELYSFNVTIEELEFYDEATSTWVTLHDSFKPAAQSLRCRFGPNQARIVPGTSEFAVELVETNRTDLGEYLMLISAGSVAGGL